MKIDDEPGNVEFFIGYAPPVPPRLARFVSRVVMGLACGVFAWTVTVASGHVTLEGGTFEFGHPQRFSGTIVERPYPALRLDESDPDSPARLLLVAPGKHGANPLVRGLDGRHVVLSGTRIRRGTLTMIEVEPASLTLGEASASPVTTGTPDAAPSSDGPVTVRGEIVDSKCFLGVMVPGSGKTHADCASLCLRGGIPPALFVQDYAGDSALMLLTGTSGETIGAPALQFAGEAVEMIGTLQRQGGWLVLRTDPTTWRTVVR
jgi:hypothetical protein